MTVLEAGGTRASRLRLLAGLAGLGIAVAGLALGLASLRPYRTTVTRRVDGLNVTGFANETLVPSGRTTLRDARVTCLPSHLFFGTEDPACAARNRQRITLGVAGGVALLLGSACWIASGTERRVWSRWAQGGAPAPTRRRATYA